MKKTLITTILIAISVSSYSQKKISGKTEEFSFNYSPVYKRGLPPNLFVDMCFNDANRNGILESGEEALLALDISNKGSGKAQGLKISISDSFEDDAFNFKKSFEILFIEPGQTKVVNIPIHTELTLKTAEHRLEINVTEHFGYDMDPAYLVLNTLEFQEPNIVFSGYEIVDSGEGTGTILSDGQIQAGEMVKLKLVVQNIGLNVAKDVKYSLRSTDENIYTENANGNLKDLGVGEVREFWVTLSPNKRVEYKQELPLYLSVTNKYDKGNLEEFQLPIVLDQKPPRPQIVEVNVNIEKITNQIARFEYSSNKFTANVGTVEDISEISHTSIIRKNSVAVIFGIENYKTLPPAPYAANDADIIKKYFSERLGVEQIVIYTNEEVNGLIFDDIFNPVNGELQKAIVKGETDLFVFYSGHGIPSNNGKTVYLFPSDGKIERLDIQGYDLNKLYTNLEKLGARSTTVFLDACFSGSSRTSESVPVQNLVASKGIKVIPKQNAPWLNNPTFSVFSSSAPNEISLGFDQSQTGLFTYYLCAGMNGKADKNADGKITNGELGEYVKNNVVETSRKIYSTQTPQFNGNREYILIEQ